VKRNLKRKKGRGKKACWGRGQKAKKKGKVKKREPVPGFGGGKKFRYWGSKKKKKLISEKKNLGGGTDLGLAEK